MNFAMSALTFISALACLVAGIKSEYYGALLGSFPSGAAHGVTGTIYAVDDRRVFIKGFNYDGLGPDAYFWTQSRTEHPNVMEPGEEGIIIPNENNQLDILGEYSNKDILLTLPDDLRLTDIYWISVWCKVAKANFGHVPIDVNFVAPAPVSLGPLIKKAHDTEASDVTILDSKRIQLTDFYYDGNGPDAYFLVGNGSPSPAGIKVPDESGSLEILGQYGGGTIILTLPDGLTWMDVEYFSVYCIQYSHNFASITIPAGLVVPPYNLPTTQVNCKQLNDLMQVSWELMDDSIDITLSGIIESDEYMSFGVSGSPSATQMIGGDVVVVYMDGSTGQAIDYNLGAKAMCAGGGGVCSDAEVSGVNDAELLAASRSNGITTISFRRRLNTGDALDKVIDPSSDTQFIMASGGLRDLVVTKHKLAAGGVIRFDQGSTECQPLRKEETGVTLTPWNIPPIDGSKVTRFVVEIGQAGKDQGYKGITGVQSWGICFYINGFLIPNLILIRGTEYTFEIHGGTDPSNLSQYHPFYITTSTRGRYTEGSSEQIFAGVDANNNPSADSVGNYCEYGGFADADEYSTFEDYVAQLDKTCQPGDPGILKWTPDENTPDVVYYQCFVHEVFGWKIHVVDNEAEAALKAEELASSSSAKLATQHLCFVIMSLAIYFIY